MRENHKRAPARPAPRRPHALVLLLLVAQPLLPTASAETIFVAHATAEAVYTPEGMRLYPAEEVEAGARVSSSARTLGFRGLGAFLAVGASATLHHFRRRPSVVDDPLECWAPEDCIARSRVHVEAQRWERAPAWTERAVALAPTSATARATRGFLLERLGREGEAPAEHQEAARLAPSEGEHDVNAARLLVRMARPDEAAARMVRALGCKAAPAPDVEGDPAFAPLRERPEVRHAVQDAWSRHIGELSRDG